MENLFFGVFPDAETARDIHAYGRELKAQHGFTAEIAAPERLHVTVAFIGSYDAAPDSLVTFACHAAGLLRHRPFTACFDKVATFQASADVRSFWSATRATKAFTLSATPCWKPLTCLTFRRSERGISPT